jgi:hypothetical protein
MQDDVAVALVLKLVVVLSRLGHRALPAQLCKELGAIVAGV